MVFPSGTKKSLFTYLNDNARNMKVVNYSDLRLNLKKWLDAVVDNVEEVIVTRKDQKDVVMISLEEYNALKETQYLLRGNNGKILLESIAEVENGKKEYKDIIEE